MPHLFSQPLSEKSRVGTGGTSEEVRGQGHEGCGRKHSGPGGLGQMLKEPQNWGFFLMAMCEEHETVSSEFEGEPSDYTVGTG